MLAIPAVDIRKGKAVQLVGGEPGTGGSYGDPLKAALQWQEKGAKRIHIIDLDAAMGDGENLEEILEIIENTQIEIQVGGGIRSLQKALKLFKIGANKIIIGTTAFKKPEELEKIIDQTNSEDVFVALDLKEDKVVIEGWKEKTKKDAIETAKKFEKKGIGGFLFTNVDVEGKLEGLVTDTLQKLVQTVELPIIAAGGVKSISDVKKAKKAGASGLVIGTALYEEELSFEEVLGVVRDEER